MDNQLDINANTKIGAILEAYPQLEDTLLRLSPSFAKLKNPVLRKTIGRMASLRQAAEVGGINIGEMVATLRKVIGQDTSSPNISDNKQEETKPEWVNQKEISLIFDASDIIERGDSPMKDILNNVKLIDVNTIMVLTTPFVPSPIIELLATKGYLSWSEIGENDKSYTYITKK